MQVVRDLRTEDPRGVKYGLFPVMATHSEYSIGQRVVRLVSPTVMRQTSLCRGILAWTEIYILIAQASSFVERIASGGKIIMSLQKTRMSTEEVHNKYYVMSCGVISPS